MNEALSPLVFAELIAELRRERFSIGTSHYLRLHQLLPHVAELSPEEMRTVLCPLFAGDAEEQARFYRAYDDFLTRRLRATAHDGRSRRHEPARPRRVRRAVWIAIALALAFAVALPLLLVRAPEQRPLERITGTAGTTTVVVRATPAVPRPALSVDTAADRARALAAKHPMLAVAAILLLILFAVELVRSVSRLIARRKHEGEGRPFTWPLRGDDADAEPFASRAFDDAARLLRGRHASGQQRLDITRTLHASIRALGHLVPVYREGQRMPEYLLLIERRSSRDHLAAYFDALADALGRAGVIVERAYFAASDPRGAAAELRHRFPDHRLVLCAGSPSALLDPVTGEPEPWVDAAFPWPYRALLVADEVAFAAPLRGLQFAIAEATVAGLRTIAEAWQSRNAVGERIEATLPFVASDPPLEHVREALSPTAGELLVRCAAHATVEWPLTCALLPRGLDAAEAERALLELSRFAWFRGGSIPPRAREQLAEELNARGDATAVRETVVRVLDRVRPPKDSGAARAREVAIVAQQMFLDRASRRRFRRDARALRRYPPAMIGADRPLLALLQGAPTTRVWRRVPRWMRGLFFPLSSPALGFHPFLGFAPLALAAAMLFFAGALTAWNPEIPARGGGQGGGGGASAHFPRVPPVAEQTTATAGTATMTTTATVSEKPPSAATSPEIATGTSDHPPVFRADDLPIPEVVPPPPATESVSPSPLAAGLPLPVLRTPVGRVDVQTGTSGPIDFAWTPYDAYELVIWKDVPEGEPIYRRPVTGVRHTWRPESLDPAATYWWTLRSPAVPATLEPQSFALNYVAPEELLARNEADQRARSRTASQEIIIALPCGEPPPARETIGREPVYFLLGRNEVIVDATAEVVFNFFVQSPSVGATFDQNRVTVHYRMSPSSFTCDAPPRARVKVTATIGPRIR